MSLPKYAEYKGSGVAWLGEVPADWPLQRFDVNTKTHRNSVTPEQLDGQIVLHYSIPSVQETGSGTVEDGTTIDSNKLVVDVPQLLVSKLNPHKQVVVLAAPHAELLTVASTEFVPLVPTKADIKYIQYVWQSPTCLHYLLARCDSATRSHQRVTPDDISKMQWAWPSENAQYAIANFLDRETGKIDALIAVQEKLIALLAEKRQATISHAVTRGLNPDAPMKDSGVAWLGKVPAHWEVKRMKHLVREGIAGPYGSTLTKAMYVASGFRVYGQQQVIPDDFSVGDYYISEAKFAEMSRYRVTPNDVLVSVMGTIGRAAVVPPDVEPGIINPRLVLYRVVERLISPRYLQTFLNNLTSQRYFSLAAQGTTMEGLNMTSIGELYVALPPPEEQLEILKFVRFEGKKLDALSAEAERAVGLLKERRSALIAAAVTGQIDVRQAEKTTSPGRMC